MMMMIDELLHYYMDMDYERKISQRLFHRKLKFSNIQIDKHLIYDHQLNLRMGSVSLHHLPFLKRLKPSTKHSNAPINAIILPAVPK